MARSSSGSSDNKIVPSTAAGLSTLATWSVLGWFFSPDNAAGSNFASVYGEDSDVSGGLTIQMKQSGALEFLFRQVFGGPTVNFTSGGVYDDSAWHWVLFIKRANNDYEAYVDGVSVGTSTSNVSTTPTSVTAMSIGGTGNVLPSGGRLAHFVAFAEALTIEQAKGVAFGRFTRMTPRFFLPIWGESTTEPDLSPNGFNGTVTGTSKADHPPQVRWRSVQGRITYPPAAYTLAMGAGAFVLTGNNAGLKAARQLTMGPGAFTLTGQAAGVAAQRKLAMGTGAFVLTGVNVSLRYSASDRVLLMGTGAFAFTGNAAALRAAHVLGMGFGAFSLTGSAVALRVARQLSLGSGALVLTGNPATLRAAHLLAMGAGAFVFAGGNLVLTLGGGAELELAPPYGLLLVDPSRALLFVDPARRLELVDPARTLEWS